MKVKRPTGTNRLRVLRAEHRLSQMDIAATLKMSRDHYWKIENGYVEPTDDEAQAFARLFRVTVTDVFPQQAA